MRVTMKKSSLGFGKLFNVLQSLIGQMASRPMRNIETFPPKQMYLCLSLVERKVAEFYLNDLFSLPFPDNWWCPYHGIFLMAFEDTSPSLIIPITDMMWQFCWFKQNVKCFLFCDIFDWIQQNHAIWRVEIIIHHKFQILQTWGRNISQGKRKPLRENTKFWSALLLLVHFTERKTYWQKVSLVWVVGKIR